MASTVPLFSSVPMSMLAHVPFSVSVAPGPTVVLPVWRPTLASAVYVPASPSGMVTGTGMLS